MTRADDQTLCERCNEYRREVEPVPFQDGTGFWNLCPECQDAVQHHGEESPCD